MGSPAAGARPTASSTSARNWAAQAAITPPHERPVMMTFSPRPWAMSTRLFGEGDQFFGGQERLLGRHRILEPVVGQAGHQHVVAAVEELVAQLVELGRRVGVAMKVDQGLWRSSARGTRGVCGCPRAPPARLWPGARQAAPGLRQKSAPGAACPAEGYWWTISAAAIGCLSGLARQGERMRNRTLGRPQSPCECLSPCK